MEQKNKARNKCLQQKTTTNKELYKEREKKQIKYANKTNYGVTTKIANRRNQ
jgi:hypothetical protein